MPPVTVTWHQGTMKPAQFTEGKIPPWGMAILLVGDKGMLLADYSKHVLLPEEKFADFKRPEPFIPKSPGHFEEWLNALPSQPTATRLRCPSIPAHAHDELLLHMQQSFAHGYSDSTLIFPPPRICRSSVSGSGVIHTLFCT